VQHLSPSLTSFSDPGRALPAQIQRHRAQTRANHLDSGPAAAAGAAPLPRGRHARQVPGQHIAGAVEGRQGERPAAATGDHRQPRGHAAG